MSRHRYGLTKKLNQDEWSGGGGGGSVAGVAYAPTF